MRSTPLRASIGAAICSVSLFTAPVAAAAPARVETDTTDNVITFEYDDSGTIASRAERQRAPKSAVRFFVSIAEADGWGSGLVARLKLRLEGDRATEYDGWFELSVTSTDGEVVYRRSRPTTIQLKPEPGRRRASVAFRFDLPSGTYDTSGHFGRDETDE